MTHKKIAMEHDKRIALVAHDNINRDLLEWATFNPDLPTHHVVYATGTTDTILGRQLGIPIQKLQSGPLGGDQQIGSRIVSKEIDFLIFFWDPLEPQPHDPDVKALLRIMDGEYDRLVPDYEQYLGRRLASVEVAESSGRILRGDPKTG